MTIDLKPKEYRNSLHKWYINNTNRFKTPKITSQVDKIPQKIELLDLKKVDYHQRVLKNHVIVEDCWSLLIA